MSLRTDSPSVRLDDIAQYVGGRVLGSESTTVRGVSNLEGAGPDDLTFVSGDRFAKYAHTSQAAAFVVGEPIKDLVAPQVVVSNPAYAFALVVQRFFARTLPSRGLADQVVRGTDVSIGEDMSIWPFVTLGDRVTIGRRVTLYPGVFIGDDCSVGDETIIYPNVTIREGTSIGARVIVHSGTVIGSDGFGYLQHQGRHHKVPQIGIVVIEDDVELGANVTVDRATFGQTRIKRGTKVDNLVQIAHNVTVGEDTILVAQVGIAGSTTLGHHVTVGGQVGISDHLTIGDQVMIGARSAVARNVDPKQVVSGVPAIAHVEFLRTHAVISRLPELRQQVLDLQQRVRELESELQQPKRTKRKKQKQRS